MYAIRAVVVAGMVLAQSAAGTGAVVAQDDLDPAAPSLFTYTMELDAYYPSFAPITDSWFIEATDPRASGLLIHNQDMWQGDPPGDETDSLMLSSHAFRLTNDGGAWSNTSRSLTAWIPGQGLDPKSLADDRDMLMFNGEGEFEGLALILTVSKADEEDAFWGVIVPTDAIPPIPDLPTE